MKTLKLAALAFGLLLSSAGVAFAQGFEVTVAPPAEQVEVQAPQPGPGYAWVRGHWVWHQELGRYMWAPGFWGQPPQMGQVWHPAAWVNFNGAYRYVPGYWRAANEVPVPPMQAVQVQVGPPAPQVEVQPPMPAPGYVWTPGYYRWNGAQHVWVSGIWRQPPSGYNTYQPGVWYNRDRNWYHASPYWRR